MATEMDPVYGPETIVHLANGGSVRCESTDANPNGTSYVRVCDPDGKEVAYWDWEEWQVCPQEIMGALLGAMRRFDR